MLDPVPGTTPHTLRKHTIYLIAKSKRMALSGIWHLEDLNGEGQPDAYSLNPGFDYLVNIDGVNNLIHPEDLPAIESIMDADHDAGKLDVKFRLITRFGTIKMLSGTAQGNGERRLFTNPMSISGQEILDSRNLLEAVFNTSTLGLHVLTCVRNEQGTIIDFDIVLTNATSDNIAGKRVSGLRMLEGWPHTRQIGLFDKFVETVESGKPLTYEHLYEGDGVRAWFQWIASTFYDGLYVTIEDITKRKNDEEALKYTADRLQSTFDGVPAIIALLEVVHDANENPVDFIISAANKTLSDFTGCSTHELIGKKMKDLYPEAFRGRLQESYIHVFATGEPLHLEFRYPGLDRWFSIFVSKQVDGKGIVVVALEITEQKKAEEQRKQNQLLAELDQAKTEFFSNVSHEFRTPLTLMLGPLSDILKKFEANTLYSEDLPKLEMIRRNTLRLQKLVNSLLDFSSVEAGRTQAIFQPTDVAEYTTLLAGNFRSVIELAGLKFNVDCQSTEPVYINQDMWEKIVLNLLSNAFKFTFEGRIELSLRNHKNYVQLQVSDTGIGIAQANISKIFERFTRIPNARSRTYEGSGIGLALVKAFIKMHDGTIKVKSTVGKGTVFVVSIPKGKAHLPPASIHELKEKRGISPLSATFEYEAMTWLPVNTNGHDPAQSTAIHPDRNGSSDQAASTHTKRVLIVDDNADIREYIKAILTTRYVVVTANNGKKALQLISEGLRPDVILTDIMMPEMDGYSLLTAIREQDGLANTPFLFLSAKASEEARVEGLRRGADDYLVKPFSATELLARIDSSLNHSTRQSACE